MALPSSSALVLLLLLLSLSPRCCLALPSSSSSCQPLLFVFGASMADTGEYSAAMPYLSRADFAPYGVDYFGRPAGRWSNGRVFTDFISQGLGYGTLNPFLKSVNANFTYGANFASAGSTARDLNETYMFPLGVQVDQFTEFLSEILDADSQSQGYSQQRIGEAVFLIETANNDYVYQFKDTIDFDALELVTDVIASIATALKGLYDLGGRNFLLMTLTPLGCTPVYRLDTRTSDADEYGCKTFFNNILEMHDSHLEELLTNMTTELPDAKWILWDAYSIFMDGYHNPEKYGIEYPFDVCCGAGGEYNYDPEVGCGESGYVNGTYTTGTRCEDPSLHVLWDSIHPVESFASVIAEGVLTGEYLRPSFNVTSTCSELSTKLRLHRTQTS